MFEREGSVMSGGERGEKAVTQFQPPAVAQAGTDLEAAAHPGRNEGRIRVQLALILNSPIFSHSRRYPAFLEFVVEQTILHQLSNLKERIIGMEVFKRPSDYDTNADPVVRVTAGEVRRRLAQYYQTHPAADVLISLPTGSYVPEFRLSDHERSDQGQSTKMPALLPIGADGLEQDGTVRPGTAATADLLKQLPLEGPSAVKWHRKKLVVAGMIGLTLVGVVLTFAIQHRLRSQPPKTALQEFWRQFAQVEQPTLIVVGEVGSLENSSPHKGTESLAYGLRTKDIVALDDADAVKRIVSQINQTAPSGRLQLSTHTSLQDLRNGPVILVGALDNAWTMKVTATAPYRFFISMEEGLAGIGDAGHPGRRWAVDFNQPVSAQHMDYAVVARLHDPTIDEDVIVAAGVGAAGTSAAAEFITSERYIDDLVKGLPADWARRNVEVVIGTQLIDGQPGKPVVLSTRVW